MGYPTLLTVTQRVLQQIGQVTGESVQEYTEPQITEAINSIFQYLTNKKEWDHLYTWETKTLDGTTGLITTGFTGVRRVEDISVVRLQGTDVAIPTPRDTEHLLVTGGNPIYVTELLWNHADHDTKFFKFWPITAVGNIEFRVAYMPETFEGNDDIIPMDETLIVLGATWWMLADDGINPASADKAQLMFDTYYQDMMARVGAKTFGFGAGRTDGRTVYIQP